jgi:hypothetical protein
MKKILLFVFSMFIVFSFSACSLSDYVKANPAASSTISAGAAAGIVAFVQNNPKYKADVVSGITLLREFLACSECSQDDVLAFIASKFPKKFMIYGIMLCDLIADNYTFTSDKISQDDKEVLIKYLDRTIKYVSLIE